MFDRCFCFDQHPFGLDKTVEMKGLVVLEQSADDSF